MEQMHRPNFTTEQPTLPGNAKGGELVLKLFVFTQVFATDVGDAFSRREGGQTMAEYGVVLSIITLAVITAIALLSESVQHAIEKVTAIFP